MRQGGLSGAHYAEPPDRCRASQRDSLWSESLAGASQRCFGRKRKKSVRTLPQHDNYSTLVGQNSGRSLYITNCKFVNATNVSIEGSGGQATTQAVQ